MDTRTVRRQASRPRRRRRSRYETVWTMISLLVAAVWVAIAILQTPAAPMLAIVAMISGIGGVPFLRAPATSVLGRRQYVRGVLSVAGLLFVTMGIAHYFTVGLATVALLGCSAPAVVRWVAGR